MTRTFLISDTHFGHRNMYKFKNSDGSKVREFDSPEEGDEIMIQRWNSVVRDNDLVYHLGDVAIPKRSIKLMDALNGRKVLLGGNHDNYKLKEYTPYFEDIRATTQVGKFILSHIPLHPDSIPRKWCDGNIHGHLHARHVMKKKLFWRVRDMRYINVSVEHIDYTPIDFERIREGSFR